MERIALIILMVFFGAGVALSQENNGPLLNFDLERYDYGTMYADNMPETKLDIKFKNTGNQPLILSQVRACCGTRVHSWPQNPILPGEEGVIKIEFRLAPRAQQISRTITVNSNSAKNPTAIFRIVGTVEER